MAKIKFTSALKRFFPNLQDGIIEGGTINEIVQNANKNHPGLLDYLLEEDGSLRRHVNIFLKDELISDRTKLTDQVNSKDEILIIQALSGG